MFTIFNLFIFLFSGEIRKKFAGEGLIIIITFYFTTHFPLPSQDVLVEFPSPFHVLRYGFMHYCFIPK